MKLFNITMYNMKCLEARMNILQLLVSFEKIPSFSFRRSSKLGRHLGDVGGLTKKGRQFSDIDNEDEFATKFIYNNGNNASTDNITAGIAA